MRVVIAVIAAALSATIAVRAHVPKQRWHLASFGGDGPSARLAMNGYVDLAHSFETK